jgi:hypothetical protein
MKWFNLVAPIGRLLGAKPLVKTFTRAELRDSLTEHGFTLEHDWTPEKGLAVFVVARKS